MCFKIFPIKIQTLLHALEPIIEALLPLWLRYIRNMHSERINRFFRCRKTLTSHFIFYIREQKKTHSVPSQDYTADVLSRGEKWSVFGGWFSWFLVRQLANKWLYTTQYWLFCVVLVVRLRHVQFFRKNSRSFAWKCFVCEQLLLDLAHLETLLQSTAVYFRTHTRKFAIHHLSRCHRRVSKHRDRIFGAFISTNRQEPFFEQLTNCVGSNAKKFFWQSNFHAILNVCWSSH